MIPGVNTFSFVNNRANCRFPTRADRHLTRTMGRVDDAMSVAEGLFALRKQGVKIRPRALVTTLFTRLFLCDLFIHGIGGAKYDELTDVLIERLYGLPAPIFLTATATVHLPIEGAPEAIKEEPADRLLRELRYHPERFLSPHDRQREDVSRWVRQKTEWLKREPRAGEGRARHAAIVEANAALQPFLEKQRKDIEQQRRLAAKRTRQHQILSARDYAYCLFPLPRIRETLSDGLPRNE